MKITKEEAKELAACLRCSASVPENGKHVLDCKKCKYLLKEEIRGEVPFPDFEENGKQYWTSCNCDQISFDAAAAIEELVECISDLIAQAL